MASMKAMGMGGSLYSKDDLGDMMGGGDDEGDDADDESEDVEEVERGGADSYANTGDEF